MGSPIAPVLANLFMSHFENKWIEEYNENQIFFYQRYVDDIFCMMGNETAANDFLSFLNSKHPDIKFTMETQNNDSLPFLDVLITSTDNKLITSIIYILSPVFLYNHDLSPGPGLSAAKTGMTYS